MSSLGTFYVVKCGDEVKLLSANPANVVRVKLGKALGSMKATKVQIRTLDSGEMFVEDVSEKTHYSDE